MTKLEERIFNLESELNELWAIVDILRTTPEALHALHLNNKRVERFLGDGTINYGPSEFAKANYGEGYQKV
jgi:hypothetical protein